MLHRGILNIDPDLQDIFAYLRRRGDPAQHWGAVTLLQELVARSKEVCLPFTYKRCNEDKRQMILLSYNQGGICWPHRDIYLPMVLLLG